MKTHFATFNRFEIEMPEQAVKDCHHQGACDEDVEHWAGADWQGPVRVPRITRPEDCTPENLRAELKEYGAWDADELADDDANWRRIIWIAAGDIQESEEYLAEMSEEVESR